MDRILIGRGDQPVYLLAKYANRHGLVAGATGTGKTVSLLVLAEGFSRLGVPVVLADVKGDAAGLALPGHPSDLLWGTGRRGPSAARSAGRSCAGCWGESSGDRAGDKRSLPGFPFRW